MNHGIWDIQRGIRTLAGLLVLISTDVHRCHENEWDGPEKSMYNGKSAGHELWRKETLRRGQQ